MTADEMVLERVRRAVAEAVAAGAPAPGRPTLVGLTGATDHQVRKALAALADESTSAAPIADEPTVDEVSTEDVTVTTGGPESPPVASAGDPDASVSPAGGQMVAWAGFLFGSVTSVAANVLAARIAPAGAGPGWTPSTVAQLGAAVWPLALLLAVEALSRVRWPSGALWRLARYGGAGTVALGSGVISYGHIHAVLSSWRYDGLAAGVGPLVIDGLMVICGFAMLAKSTQDGRRR